LLNGLNEGVTTWIGLHLIGAIAGTYSVANPTVPAFAWLFSSTWILMWLAVQGPIRVVLVRWRFRGGRIL
jgi:hypothetical protein